MLGEKLRKLRGRRTQEEIATKLGISRARYSHYENNHVQPDNDLLVKLAEFYEVSTDYLVGRDLTRDLDENSKILLEGFDKISKEDQEYIINLIQRISKV